MRRISGIVIALTLVAFAAAADEQSDHVEHLRMMIAAMSSHGPVIPQPQAIDPLAARTIAIVARSFDFSPATFTVNQGDVVTISLSVPSNDASSIGHGILMETYIENQMDVPRGATSTRTFTATTAGTFIFVCSQPNCGTGHSSMFGQMIVNAVAQPTISSVSPNVGSINGGTSVTITGTNFSTSGTTSVLFGVTPSTNVTVNSSTSVSAVTPNHSEGTVDVVVNTNGLIATAAGAFAFVNPKPAAIVPATGSTAGGTAVTINGSGFLPGATVAIGGIPATDVVVSSATLITARTPLGPANEQVGQPRDVVVTNPDGVAGTLARAFSYFVPALSVISITPAVGIKGGGTVVTFIGTGFTTALNSSVSFGGVTATNISVVDAVTMQATAPAHAVGSVDIVVNVGGSSVTKAGAFSYQEIPPRHRSARH